MPGRKCSSRQLHWVVNVSFEGCPTRSAETDNSRRPPADRHVAPSKTNLGSCSTCLARWSTVRCQWEPRWQACWRRPERSNGRASRLDLRFACRWPDSHQPKLAADFQPNPGSRGYPLRRSPLRETGLRLSDRSARHLRPGRRRAAARGVVCGCVARWQRRLLRRGSGQLPTAPATAKDRSQNCLGVARHQSRNGAQPFRSAPHRDDIANRDEIEPAKCATLVGKLFPASVFVLPQPATIAETAFAVSQPAANQTLSSVSFRLTRPATRTCRRPVPCVVPWPQCAPANSHPAEHCARGRSHLRPGHRRNANQNSRALLRPRNRRIVRRYRLASTSPGAYGIVRLIHATTFLGWQTSDHRTEKWSERSPVIRIGLRIGCADNGAVRFIGFRLCRP